MLIPRRAPSLRVQLALGFGLLALALAGFLSLSLGAMLYAQTEHEQGAALRAISKNIARSLADDLRKNLRSVQVLAASPSIWSQGLASPGVKAVLERVQTVNPDNSWIGVADRGGIVRAATNDLLLGQSVAARPWFAPGLRGPLVGDVHAAKLLAAYLPPSTSGEPRRFVDFAAPIMSGDQAIGVLAIHGSWDWADAVVQKLSPERASGLDIKTFIFDRSGQIIYSHGGDLAAMASAGQRVPAVSGPSSLAASAKWSDGVEYLTASFRLPQISPTIDLGWTVVTRQPTQVAFAQARAGALAALALGAAGAACAVLLGWRLASRLTLPLSRIAKAAKQVAYGNAEEIPAQRGSREIAELSGALGDMTARLLASNRDLEDRVRERTEALTAANIELDKAARVDPLTGLLNRRGLDEQARYAVANARRSGAALSALLVDADHFKRVNDVYGHAAGDAALTCIAETMRSLLRESDIVARMGGEEFAALLPDTEVDGAMRAADKIVAAMRELDIPGVGRVTVSCGVSAVGIGDGDVADALARADRAMYQAKRDGRDRSCLDVPISLGEKIAGALEGAGPTDRRAMCGSAQTQTPPV